MLEFSFGLSEPFSVLLVNGFQTFDAGFQSGQGFEMGSNLVVVFGFHGGQVGLLVGDECEESEEA